MGLKCFSCPTCHWTQEAKTVPVICPRCLAANVQPVSVADFMQRLDRGVVQPCRACGIIHTF